MTFGILKNSKFRDCRGERVWFPKDERPYYDKALGRKFNTVKEKHAYMKEKGFHMDGSSDKGRNHPEAGDTNTKKTQYFT